MDRETTKQTLRDIRQALPFDAEVTLFGSRARGDYYPNSDWDIAIISDAFEGIKKHRRPRKIRSTIREYIDGPIDLVCYTWEEYERGKRGFLPELIEKEGVRADDKA